MSDEAQGGQAEADDKIISVSAGVGAKAAALQVEDSAPPPAAADAEPEGKLPEWMAKRLGRSKEQRDEARAEASAAIERSRASEARYDEAIGTLRRLADRLDPARFESYDEYLGEVKSLKERLAGAEQAKAAAAAPEGPPSDFVEAMGDLRSTVPDDLWARATSADVGHISQAMVIAMADAEDPEAALRGILALSDEERAEVAELSRREMRRAIRDLSARPKLAEAARDAQGRFTPAKKASAAPEPMQPVGNSGAGPLPLDHPNVSQAEFERRRNEEEGTRQRFGW